MKIGVRGHDYRAETPAELAKAIRAAGFEAVQLALYKAVDAKYYQYGYLNPGFCRDIRRAFECEGLEIAVVGGYIDCACADTDRRLAEVKRFGELTAYCAQLGSYVVATETSNYSGDEAGRRAQFARLTDSVLRMTETAEKFGVFVGVEPVWAHTMNTPEMTRRLFDIVRSPNLKVVLDPINLLTPDRIDCQKEIIDACFDAFGDQIVAVHAKDVTLDENGRFRPCVIGQGLFDHAYFYRKLHAHKPGITVLREEARPETARLDIQALTALIAAAENG